MNVTVRYAAQAGAAAGTASERVDLSGAPTVGDLLVRLAERHGDALRRLLVDGDGRPQESLLLVVGDEQVRSGRPLKDGDVIDILTPISGG